MAARLDGWAKAAPLATSCLGDEARPRPSTGRLRRRLPHSARRYATPSCRCGARRPPRLTSGRACRGRGWLRGTSRRRAASARLSRQPSRVAHWWRAGLRKPQPDRRRPQGMNGGVIGADGRATSLSVAGWLTPRQFRARNRSIRAAPPAYIGRSGTEDLAWSIRPGSGRSRARRLGAVIDPPRDFEGTRHRSLRLDAAVTPRRSSRSGEADDAGLPVRIGLA
jgi:hypothetical protein